MDALFSAVWPLKEKLSLITPLKLLPPAYTPYFMFSCSVPVKSTYLLWFVLGTSLVHLEMLCHIHWIVGNSMPGVSLCLFLDQTAAKLFMNPWAEWSNCHCSWWMLFSFRWLLRNYLVMMTMLNLPSMHGNWMTR